MVRAQRVKYIKEKGLRIDLSMVALPGMGAMVADVVMFAGIPKVLSYAIPEDLFPEKGCRVVAPVRKSSKVGVVIGIREDTQSDKELKTISGVLDPIPCIAGELIELIEWCSRYYHANIGSCMALAFPPSLRKARAASLAEDPLIVCTHAGKGRIGLAQEAILQAIPEAGLKMSEIQALFPGCAKSVRVLIHRGYLEGRTVQRDHRTSCLTPIEYTPDQGKAIAEISTAIHAGNFHTFVLHGITGSGKTEVYLASAEEALKLGKSVLYLVPEIALTPQTIAMIQGRIAREMAVFHSGLSAVERSREFLRVAHGGVRFVLGTRSAVFSPLTRIGLVIVDEEHDGSYKQEDGVTYNARDLGILRARNNSATVILGSATPSMETYVRPKSDHASLITMPSRVGPAALPKIEIVDMRGIKGALSENLLKEMDETLSRGGQVLLFINRRGFSAAMVCPGCGKALHCSRCDRSLTYHKSRRLGLCHWCGFTMKLPEICPSCGCLDMKPIGMGTERVFQAVEEAFPDARVLRMDSDEMTSSGKLSSALDAIRAGSVDIIVGTQMIAKGHDFPHLELVGVVNAEQLLYMPDFRAGERTFQQIVQVAGRAGRRKSDTKVLIQTLIPEHPLIGCIARYDYQAMIEAEKGIRKASGFPPFMHLTRCVVSSSTEKCAREAALSLVSAVTLAAVEVLGPAPAPISLLRDRYRWHVILRSRNRSALHRTIEAIEQVPLPSGVDLKIDVDPYSMM
ncbi:MAG TPA: primosomal protein N' [Deltaproteobacteria bacterium]|nr:primosomal protein N' [Deltaproteobacteria bacterium]